MLIETLTMDDRHFYSAYVSQGGGSNIHEIGALYSQPRFNQRGAGIGGVFQKLFQYIKPLLISGLHLFKEQGLKSGVNVLSDLSAGTPLSQSLKSRGKEIVTGVRDKIVSRIQGGAGRVRKRVKRLLKRGKKKTNKKTATSKNLSHLKVKGVRRSKPNKRILDIFT